MANYNFPLSNNKYSQALKIPLCAKENLFTHSESLTALTSAETQDAKLESTTVDFTQFDHEIFHPDYLVGRQVHLRTIS